MTETEAAGPEPMGESDTAPPGVNADVRLYWLGHGMSAGFSKVRTDGGLLSEDGYFGILAFRIASVLFSCGRHYIHTTWQGQ